MNDLKSKSISEILGLHVSAMNELRSRGVLRTENTPTGDLAEYLFCKAFDWEQEGNSAKSYDATDRATQEKYQIKARRVHNRNQSRQLSSIRDLSGFDVLAGVIFDEAFLVVRAALVPVNVVRANSRYTAHTNSHLFHLRDTIWTDPTVTDVTEQLRKAYDN